VTAPPASDLELLRGRFERLARVECAQRSPLWAEVCLACAADDGVLELMLCAPTRQRRPSLLLAAIHDLLLAGVPHDLAAHLPTVADGSVATGSAGALALELCREHRHALADVLATRSTQTNEVNRCAALLPALARVTPLDEPLRLVELGASAGLNLLVDRFAYRYDGAGPVGDTTSRVVCACAVDGALPPLALPRIDSRVGVDLSPIDVRDDDAARWLLACVWPDEADRCARVRAAIELAREDPPQVVRGDALELLPELVAGEAHPVIWHSWVLAYWSAATQRALAVAIDEIGARRDLTWVYLEQPLETPGLPTPALRGVRHHPDDSALVAVTYRDANRAVTRLADAHPHAHRMRWLAPAA
jgi:hypothetical protein